jgi:hypothetical protein
MVIVMRVFVAVVFPLYIVFSRHDENAAIDMNHVDWRPVQA